MRILAIETSCDETAIALLEANGGIRAPKFKVVAAEVASQIKVHAPFGGVVPNLAKREHEKSLPALYHKIFNGEAREARLWKSIDAVGVTVGPGLEPALWAGIVYAKELSKKYKKPLIGANHLEGHLYSFLLPQKNKSAAQLKNIFPAVGLIVSGGHTILLKLKSLVSRKKLGETQDDAVGEAFDKVARMLNLPYPGGPEVQKLADTGNGSAISFPRPMLHAKDFNFSFSGLKTSVLYYLRDNPKCKKEDVAASFTAAAVDVLAAKTMRAVEKFGAKSVLLSGGVAANKHLRERLQKDSKRLGIKFFVPEFKYNTDNAVMIAVGAYILKLQKKSYPLVANGNLNIR
jgi:N6-L-threonylcarbamoyladenine synthase